MNYAHIHSILKLRPLFLYWTYELIPIFITFNRTEVSLFKQVNNRHEKKHIFDEHRQLSSKNM